MSKIYRFGAKLIYLRHLIISAIFFFLLITLLDTNVFSQGIVPNRSVQNFTPVSISDFETIGLHNGNVMLNYPLASLPPARGGLNAAITLSYYSNTWNTVSDVFTEIGPTGDPRSWDLQVLDNDIYSYSGWKYNYDYRIKIENRSNSYSGDTAPKCPDSAATRDIKVKMQFPDGSEHEMRPVGFTDLDQLKGWFYVGPNGYGLTCVGSPNGGNPGSYLVTTNKMVYYSTDSSYSRLEVEHSGPWTLYLPNGNKVTGKLFDNSISQKIYDRNGNFVEIQYNWNNFQRITTISDQLGRSIRLEEDSETGRDYLYSYGVNDEEIKYTVVWGENWVRKLYKQFDPNNIPGYPNPDAEILSQFRSVVQIIQPAQLDSQVFSFGYNGSSTQPQTYTNGWGELNSITLPSGAQINYQYTYDGQNNVYAGNVVNNSITQKNLTYLREYDGTSTPVTETWQYFLGGLVGSGGTIINPDGGIYSETFKVFCGDNLGPSITWDCNLLLRSTKPDGTKVERIWQPNTPFGSRAINPLLKTEFISVKNSAGSFTLTKITDYEYDKNGNITSTTEYDWVPYSAVPRDPNLLLPTGIPSGIAPKRVTVNTFYNPTPNSSDSTSNSPYAYWNVNSPNIKNGLSMNEVKDGDGNTVAGSELSYDNPSTTGNPTETKVWDSFKNGASQPYSNPLTSTNSISATTEYDQYGNPTLTTDAKGYQTQITYGSINGFAGLYPTQTITAYGKVIQRTSTAEYDFYTGLVKKITDVDNNVSTETVYDALGRPTKVMAAVGTPLEVWTQTEYNDTARRVITRSDLYVKGDAKKVATQFYDQLGRVRLSKTLEDAATQSATNETDGIKVQTRYRTDNPNSYQLVSNPYRATTSAGAASEPSMGWTRSKSVNTGKYSETEAFSGAALPAPFVASNANTSSTGIVRTDVDANRTLVTDQAGKQRISQTNALGQLTNVWEIKLAAEAGQTEAISFGNPAIALNGLKTSYSYDTLNNLKTVNQGVQTRSFFYDSLSRLKSATNPELGNTVSGTYVPGTISYLYDNNGNLTQKTDARGVVTAYGYDELNRVLTRSYSNEPSGQTPTLPVTYTYDNVTNAKGRLTKVETGVVATLFSVTEYTKFDKLGRVEKSKQTTDGIAYPEMTYSYYLSGALNEQKYPSGRVVKNVLDNDGDLSIVQSKKNTDAAYWSYAKNFTYTAAGAVSSMQLGNDKIESTQFNSRLQPTQIALGTTEDPTNLLKLNYEYGNLNVNNGQTIEGTNNGNISKQLITVPTTAGQPPALMATQYYAYDELNRISQANEIIGVNTTNWTQFFKYDRYGNRNFDESPTTTIPKNCGTVQNPTVCPNDVPIYNPTVNPANNRLDGYIYDAAGNTTRDAQSKKFTYDGENKQTKVETVDAGGNPINTLGTYFYDGDGKRVKKIATVNGQLETTLFVYNANGQLVAEYSTTVATSLEAKVSYLTSDHLGSPRINTDATGAVISRHDYHPFGEEVALVGPRAGYGSDSVRQKFTAYERDDESDLDFAQARYYSSKLGRFYSVDPENYGAHTDDAQSWNGYNYGRSNPLVYSDPEGLEYLICTTGQGKRECYRHNDADVHKSMKEGLLFYDGTKSSKNGLRSGVIRDENGDPIASYQQISHDDPIQAMLWGAKPVLDIWQTPVEMAQPAPIPGGGVIGTTAKVGTKGAKGFVLGTKVFKSSGFVGRALEKLGLVASTGSKGSKGVLEVVGTSDDALMLFNELRGANKVRMVGPNRWVADSASGTGTITFRRGGGNAIKSRTNAAVDVHGVEPGLTKIHFKQ